MIQQFFQNKKISASAAIKHIRVKYNGNCVVAKTGDTNPRANQRTTHHMVKVDTCT